MPNITFSEGSGLNDSIFGKSQAPIRLFLEKRAEAFEAESVLPRLFMQAPSKHYAEKYASLTAMDGFQPVGENGAYPTDGVREGYSKTIENMTWKDSFSISRELIDDATVMELRRRPEAFITGFYRTREKFAAALFGAAVGKATDTTFGGKHFSAASADGKCLFATDHPSILGGDAQSNQFADAFSNDALMAAACAMQDFRDDNGAILDVSPDTIIIPNDYQLKKDVFAAIGADKDPATANNGFNYNFGMWNVIVWPYLNKFVTEGTAPWMLCDSRYNKAYGGAIWQDRVPLEVKSEIAHNDANEWKGYARFSAGFNDWRAFSIGGITGGTQLIAE